jgi:hypothetical protein
MNRVVIAAIVGGVIEFAWGAAAHMATPLGMMGLSPLPAEAVLMPAMKLAIEEPGTYMFPGYDPKKEYTEEEMEAWEAKHREGPVGLLIYKPVGGEPMKPGMLVNEFISNVLAALIAAVVAALMVGSYGKRVVAIGLMGLFAWLSINVSYWNWYGFSGGMTVAEGIMQTVGWLLSGLAIAAIVPAARAAVREQTMATPVSQ